MPLDDSFYYPGTAARPVNLPLNWSPEMNNKVQQPGRVARDVYYLNGSSVPMYIPSGGIQQRPIFSHGMLFNRGFVGSPYPMPLVPFMPQQYQQYQFPTPGYYPNRLPEAPIQAPSHFETAQDLSSNVPMYQRIPDMEPIQNAKTSDNKHHELPTPNGESIEIVQINDDFPRKNVKPTYTIIHMEAIAPKPAHLSEYADSQVKPNFMAKLKHNPKALVHSQSAPDVRTQPVNAPQDWSNYVPMHQLNQPFVPRQAAPKNPTKLLSQAQKVLGLNLPSDFPSHTQSPDLSHEQATPQNQSGGALESKDEILGANMESDFKQHAQLGGARGGEPKVQWGNVESRDQPIWSN
jgi:hypothetical protein